MTIRFTVKTIEKLCDILRSQVDDVRRYEREMRKIVVDRCGMPQEHFIKHLPAQRAEPEVGREGGRRGQALQRHHGRNLPAIQELQQKLIDLQAKAVVPLEDLKEINRR
jgi:RNA polymerase primary sigma factor